MILFILKKFATKFILQTIAYFFCKNNDRCLPNQLYTQVAFLSQVKSHDKTTQLDTLTGVRHATGYAKLSLHKPNIVCRHTGQFYKVRLFKTGQYTQ